MTLKYIEIGNTENPKNIVFILHGYGSNKENMIPIAHELNVSDDILFCVVDAPYDYSMGGGGKMWFEIFNMRTGGRLPAKDVKRGVDECYSVLQSFLLERLENYKLTWEDAIMSGFSQGCMLSLHVAVMEGMAGHKIKGVLGYSGRLMFLPSEIKAITSNIALAHGNVDDVVEYEHLADAKERLAKVGVEAKTLTCNNLDHAINLEGIEFGRRFLENLLSEV